VRRAAALALLLAAPAPAQEMPDAVGRLTHGAAHRPGAALCTATLVAPDLALTAAHCVRGAVAAPQSLLFAAGYRAGRAAGSARVREVILSGGRGGRADAALVRLERPLPGVAPLPVVSPEADAYIRFGYRRDAPESPEPAVRCTVRARPVPRVVVDCPAVSGNSGAPLLAPAGDSWAVAGLLVSSGGGLSVAEPVPADLAARLPAAD
jgi:hypothetical protein